jgi:uncharacterized membrane protein YphA (DoxX/SURF4 family)
MSVTSLSAKSLNVKSIAFIILKIVLAVLFFAAAGAKLAGVKMMVAEFNLVGLGQWFRYLTAIIEITGAGLLLWPGRSAFGALILAGVCAGAFVAQVFAIHMDFIHTIILGMIFFAIAWVQRAQLRGLRV